MNIMTVIDNFINNSMKYASLRSAVDKAKLREQEITIEEKLELSKLESSMMQVSELYDDLISKYSKEELLMIIHKLDERIMKSQEAIIKSYSDLSKSSKAKRAEKRIEDRKIMYYRAFIKDLNNKLQNAYSKVLR